jgi:hypothetical protein
MRLQGRARNAWWIGSAFVSDAEASVLVQPGEGAFDDRPFATEA